MGVMRFLVSSHENLEDWPEVFRAYVSGLDGRVYPTRIEVHEHLISCRRFQSDSGRLHVAFPLPGRGRPILCTSSLSEREEPYLLPVELARGKISQVRDQLSNWQLQGMIVPDEFWPLHRSAHQRFAIATSCQEERERSCRLAREALVEACAAADMLTQAYTRQRLVIRRRRGPQLPAAIGCRIDSAVSRLPEQRRNFSEAFDAAFVPIEWRNIEPEEGNYRWEDYDRDTNLLLQERLMVVGGPLLDFSTEGLPTWLWRWENDVLNLQSFISDFVETAIRRYQGRIRHWEVSARGNTGGALALSEEHRLTLVAKTLEVARQADPEVQLMIRVDQPWGDYQARGQHRLSPLQFVDALVRSGLGLSAVNLEISVGYRPRGTAFRDLMEFSRLIDLWSLMGIPLYVTLAFPSDVEHDAMARTDLEVDVDQWRSSWSEQSQAEWIDDFIPLLMAKQAVVGVFWNHFSDSERHYFPHAGLLDVKDQPKPGLSRLMNCRPVSGDTWIE